MDEWDRDAVYAEIDRLSRAMHQQRAIYFDRSAQPTPGAERLGAHDDAELTDDNVRAAKAELAEKHYVGFGHVENMALEAHQKSGLGYSIPEQCKVVAEVALTLGRGQQQVSDEQILELSRYGQDDILGLAADVPADGDEGDAVALAGTRESRARRARAAGQDDADSVIARHPEFAHLFRAGKTSSRRHPRRSDRMVTTRTRAHSSDTGDDDTQDRDQPARGGDVHEKLRALIERNPDLLTDGKGRTVPEVNYQGYPVKSAEQREAEQRRAEGGHGRGARSIEDLAAGSARTRYGR